MQEVDVLIIGGGPAGSTLAWALQTSGLRTHILEKRQFPRDKTCAGWVTPAVFEALLVDPEEYGQCRTLQPITGFRIALMGQPPVLNSYGGAVVSYGVRRCEFDQFLLARSGATVAMGEPFETASYERQGWIINNRYRARLLVGGGGHFCPVAQVLGARLGRQERVVSAKEVEFSMTHEQQLACAVTDEVPELYFCKDLKGYGWVFRKQNYLNVGLGREDHKKLGGHLQQFVAELQTAGRIPSDLPKRFKGHAYILYDHGQRTPIGDHALLIGDAAGLAYTQSGEGIRPAVESALLAAKVIAAASGDYSMAQLEPYAQALTQRFGRRQHPPLLPLSLPASFRTRVARTLMRSRWFTHRVVTDRWFLHRQQAPLHV